MTNQLAETWDAVADLIADELNKLPQQMRRHIADEQEKGGSIFCMVTTSPSAICILLASHDPTKPHYELARLYPGNQTKKAAVN